MAVQCFELLIRKSILFDLNHQLSQLNLSFCPLIQNPLMIFSVWLIFEIGFLELLQD